MKYFVTIISFCFLLSLSVIAQISVNRPIKSALIQQVNSVKFLELPPIDVDKALAQDALDLKSKETALRFGIPVEMRADFFNLSQSSFFPDGSVVYQLGIIAPGAKSLNLIFSEFDLEDGSWMHIYDPGKKELLGAFTKENVIEGIDFATVPLFSDSLIIEVFCQRQNLTGRVVIDKAIWAYRDIREDKEQFGSSGPCNINVACPEGQAWLNQVRSVVLLISGGTNNRLCSGALINNVLEDGKPYLLTADHCPVAVNNVAIFNYQSPQCQPSKDSSFKHSINGMTILARNNISDFLLSLLSSKPPGTYNAYFAGWNNSGDQPLRTTAIHHPKGDVKKISFDFKPSISSGYYSKGIDHWKVASWDVGTTENVSSGSPLFDQHHLIVGQLHGGDASCDSPEEADYFGKLSLSWDLKSDSGKQLKHWLDPTNSGASAIYGFDPNAMPLSYDLALMGFVNFESRTCGSDSIRPSVLIKNRGSSSIAKFEISYFLNNLLINKESVNSVIPAGGFLNHQPPYLLVSPGHYNLTAQIDIPSQADADQSNNKSFTELYVSDIGYAVELILKTDDDGNETNWDLMSNTGAVIASGGGYDSKPGGQIIKDTFCLYDGCFKFVIYDDYGDGICCNFGSGYYVLRDLNTGDSLVSDYNFKGSDTSHYFCLGDSCSIMARAFIKGSSSLTSADGEIFLEMLSGNPPFTFLWSNGANSQSITQLLPGKYWVLIKDSLNCSDTLFFEVGIGTGLNPIIKEGETINLYPNPSNGLLNIEGLVGSASRVFRIYDIRGQIKHQFSTIDNAESMQLNLSFLPSGLYLMEINAGGKILTKRFVITAH